MAYDVNTCWRFGTDAQIGSPCLFGAARAAVRILAASPCCWGRLFLDGVLKLFVQPAEHMLGEPNPSVGFQRRTSHIRNLDSSHVIDFEKSGRMAREQHTKMPQTGLLSFCNTCWGRDVCLSNVTA